MATRARAGVPAKAAALAAVGYAGGAMCIVLVYLGMRSVMDIGGYCAEGGPYVIAQTCPDEAVPALLLGMFGMFLFGAIATAGGFMVGGIWAAAPILGWSALFGLLGWNFMEYGVFAAQGDGIDLGWAICGIVFWAMAAAPLLAIAAGLGNLLSAPTDAVAYRQARKEARIPYQPDPAAGTIIRIVGPDGVRVVPADDPEAREQLAAVAAAMEAALDKVEGVTPALVIEDSTVTVHEPQTDGTAGGADFAEGTQALLDRLERLADMRDRGLLEPAEYETAKDAIVRELESRQ